MIFSSLLFLCIFLPVVLGLYYASKNMVYKNLVLVISSLIFYAWGEPVWILALLFSAVIDYIHGRIIDKYFGKWQAKAALISSLVLNLGILMTFKYLGFFNSNINFIFKTNLPVNVFSLPLGISFYTFQTLSYTIDMYRGEIKVQRSLLKFMAYVSMFPQLVAGPIVRYIDIEKQIDNRTVTKEKFEQGIIRFAQGLFKKVILANSAGKVAAMLLDGKLSELSALGAWLGILMYTFQIYFDFSGYSDMAIGLGKFFGFDFLENFNYPYMSKNVTEFWRRWHISLSTFFRDYVYIPLGGNRHDQIRNIIVVWALTGFWHGASWNFILWGLYYGLLLIIEKKCFNGKLLKLPAPIGVLYSMLIVIFGWTLFYFTDMARLGEFLKAMFGGNAMLADGTALSILWSNIFIIAALAIASTDVIKIGFEKLEKTKISTVAVPAAVVISMFICFTMLVGQTYNPFLYFRF